MCPHLNLLKGKSATFLSTILTGTSIELYQVVGCHRVNIFTFLISLPLVVANKSIKLLTTYGYLEEHSLTDSIEEAILMLLEAFHLEQMEILDNATLEFLNRPRCGNKDIILPFNAQPVEN